jgi:hypothetical protein
VRNRLYDQTTMSLGRSVYLAVGFALVLNGPAVPRIALKIGKSETHFASSCELCQNLCRLN